MAPGTQGVGPEVPGVLATDLLLLQLGDLLLYHGDLAIHTVHVLDQLLLGQSRWRQLQLRVSVRWAGG